MSEAREVRARLAEVLGRIEAARRRAGREDPVELVAVSKHQPWERVRAAWEAGQRRFGENYVQALVQRREGLPDAELHLIGHLQTNKAKLAARAATVVETVDSVRVAEALAKAVSGPPLRVLVEVHLGGEDTKSGVAEGELAPLLEALARLPALSVEGLMCVPPAEGSRRHFAALRGIAEAMRARTGLALPALSMGMSADFEDAILEGATLVRVGTAIFGERYT